MKNSLKVLLFALLVCGLFACSEKKITLEDLNAAEATLMGENWQMNMDEAPKVAKKYCQFVKQNPNDSTAAKWLFHAMEINVMLKDVDKSVKLCDQLLEQYPQSKWAPMSLLLLGSYVYEDILDDTAQAHVAYQRLIDDYPESNLVEDAQKSIEYLGLTLEERMSLFMMSQMDVEDYE